MVVNAKVRAVTQRVEPGLALVEVDMPPEAFAEDWQPDPDSNSRTCDMHVFIYEKYFKYNKNVN
jgi:hypothetical protein